MSDSDHPKFTCNTCGLAFAEADYQRDHMKTDWHRYNLKRRVAGLPPIPSDVFAEKMIQQRSAQVETKTRGSGNRQITKKELRRLEKQRLREEAGTDSQADAASLNSRANSMTSAMSAFSLGDPVRSAYQTEDDDFSEEEQDQDDVEKVLQQKLATAVKIPTNVCFMDGKKFDSVDENVEYLETRYGLYVPERKYLQDLDGLVEYINEKVGLGNCCLSCSYMGRSLEAVRAHMLSKQHIKIPYETSDEKMELADFYDFSSSYANQDGWEDVSDDGEADSTVRIPEDGEEDVAENNLYVNGYELVLGPNKTAGHRELQRYYKQRFGPMPEKEGRKAVKMIDQRSPGVTEKEATKLIKQTWKGEKKYQHTKLRRDKWVNHQPHYRDELLQ